MIAMQAPRTKRALKQAQRYSLAILLSLHLSAQPAPPAKPACQPCTLAPGKDQPTFTFTLDPSGRAAKPASKAELVVFLNGKEVQRLALQDSGPLLEDPRSAFLGVDLNLDGLLDLQVITSQGAANAYADVWLYKPAEKRFIALGNYPVLTPDASQRTLKTYERNGEGGMAYTAKVYAFAGDRLELLHSEVQAETPRPGVFRLTVRDRIHGVLKVTSQKFVHAQATSR